MSRRSPSGSRGRGGTVRVISGSFGGRQLATPPGSGTRPTANRVREATFNALDSLGAVADARVLDGFAGSGALGIEALSRGASRATFVDVDPAAVEVVRENLAALGLAGSARVVAGTLASALRADESYDLVLLDPPYGWQGWPDLLHATVPRLAVDGVVVIESDREVTLPPGLVGVRTKTYGGTVVQFATLLGDPS